MPRTVVLLVGAFEVGKKSRGFFGVAAAVIKRHHAAAVDRGDEFGHARRGALPVVARRGVEVKFIGAGAARKAEERQTSAWTIDFVVAVPRLLSHQARFVPST